MEGAVERVRAMLAGRKPDRIPLYDLLRNDAVVEYFAGQALSEDLSNAEQVVYTAYRRAIDATRPRIRLPQPEGQEQLPDGRLHVRRRWTDWVSNRKYPSLEAYVARKRQAMSGRWDWSDQDARALEDWIATHKRMESLLGEECFLFWGSVGTPGLMGLYDEIGLEEFSYLMYDCPEIIDEQMEFNTVKAVQMIEHIPDPPPLGPDLSTQLAATISDRQAGADHRSVPR